VFDGGEPNSWCSCAIDDGTRERSAVKVALISPVGDVGGGERVLMALAEGLEDRGHTCRIFCLRSGSWTAGAWGRGEGKISTNQSGYRLRYPWTVLRAGRWLREELVEFSPQIVHANHGSWWITAVAIRSMAVKSVWHLHDYPDRIDAQTRFGLWMPPSASIFTTKRVASGFPSLTSRKHAVIAPMTLDAENFRNLPQETSILDQHGLRVGGYLLTVCRWQPHKGIHHWVNAAHGWSRAGDLPSRLRFVVVGNPSNDSEREYERECQRIIAGSSLSERFVFVRGCTEASLRCLYRHAFALVHPAVTEGFGLVLLEAMAFGVPVVAAAAAGPMEILEQGKYGLVADVGSSESLTAAVRKLATNSRLRAEMGERALERSKQFDRAIMVEQTIALYRELLSDNP
jgi:glycosyltransferase involved in cell wall biosynthesis